MSKRTREPTISPAEAARSRALLQVWLSPSFPVGGFAYSQGLERAAEQDWVHDRLSLQAWLSDLVAHGPLANDVILCAAAWRACHARDRAALDQVAALGAALQPSAERFLEATQQGRSFIDQIDAAWPVGTARIGAAFDGTTPTYAVALGFAAAKHDIPLADTVQALAVGMLSNLVSAAIRLSIVGQTDAQRVMAALIPYLIEAAERGQRQSLTDLGSSTIRADIASMQHETQHTRLFRS